MPKFQITAPCKINLCVDILSKRADEYHEMDMVMQAINLSDTITLETVVRTEGEPEIVLECGTPGVPCDNSNIVLKCAYGVLREADITLKKEQIKIRLEKRIPIMAGLGGGSADGAAIIKALNQMYHIGMSRQELYKIGQRYGADVPFCIHGGTVRARGTGHELTDLPQLPACHIVIAKPKVSVSTREAFIAWDKCATPPHANVEGMVSAVQSGDLKAVADSMANIFIFLLNPQQQEEVLYVQGLLMKYGAMGAVMSGSGSAVFGIFDHYENALKCRYLLEQDIRIESAFVAIPIYS